MISDHSRATLNDSSGLSQPLSPALTEPFCSYCGYPPRTTRRERKRRVCRHCGVGVVLYAPANGAPRHSDLFLILNERSTVQAMSSGAETVLMVDEPAGIDNPLASFLIEAGGNSMSRLVALALDGCPSPDPVRLRAAHDLDVQFQARVSSCGPPSAALLLLTPVPAQAISLAGRGPSFEPSPAHSGAR